jgi:23S rRNA pseudouridine1911/1915/1917 synthase
VRPHRVEHPARLVDHAKAHLVAVPVREIGELITTGAITVNGHRGRIGELVQPGDTVEVARDAISSYAFLPEDIGLVVRHEDAELLVCDKPAGMHVHPLGPHRAGTLLNALLWNCGARPDEPWGAWRPSPLHRLDRPARGLVAFAKGATSHEQLRPLFESGGIERRYRAVVHGRVSGDAGTIDAPLGRDPVFDYRRAIVPVERGGQRAITHWTAVERSDDRTELAVWIETGRTHQIRAHLASIGHPIVGDMLYGAATTVGDVAGPVAIELYATELRIARTGRGEPLVVRTDLFVAHGAISR